MKPNRLAILGPGHEVVSITDVLKWATTIEAQDRTVAVTALPGDIRISTVFLGVNHRHFTSEPDLWFETMVFIKGEDVYQDRYTTWDEAVEGHKRAVQKYSVVEKK